MFRCDFKETICKSIKGFKPTKSSQIEIDPPSKNYSSFMKYALNRKSNEKSNQNVCVTARSHIFNNSKLLKPKDVISTSLHWLARSSGLHLRFKRLNTNDPVLDNLFRQVCSKDKCKLLIIEGRRLIAEALKCKLELEALLFSKDEDLRLLIEETSLLPLVRESPIYKVPRHSLKTWSILDSPPGLLAIFHRPMENQLVGRSDRLPITVVCDNVREPNNLGSIIRTCAALPCYEILTIKGCCDPWNPKSIRGGCGGHFHINIRNNIVWEELFETSKDFNVFIAESNLNKVQSFPFKRKSEDIMIEYDKIKSTSPHNVVIIGGETHGVSRDAYKFLDHCHSNSKFVHIPMANGVESLNVTSALTLILYELRKICFNNRNMHADVETGKKANVRK